MVMGHSAQAQACRKLVPASEIKAVGQPEVSLDEHSACVGPHGFLARPVPGAAGRQVRARL
jgi:hypothetical protein